MTLPAKLGLGAVGAAIILWILISLGSSPLPAENQNTKSTPQPSTQGLVESATVSATDLVKVARVIDGDTFELATGQTVRMIGIDTPETVHPSKPVQCMGKEASAKTKVLLEGKSVKLEKDISETDKYDRLLRYVYLEDGTFINDLLVREGFASSSSYPPDVKYQDKFREAEQSARNNKWGLWSGVCNSPTLTPTVTPKVATPVKVTPTNAPAAVAPAANCSADNYNCSDFSSCREVMEVFNACSGDPNGLDGDDDGVPCESLCN